ncbi:hypothetical protein GCM10027027_19460 [Neomicrococcus lactis]
MDSTILEFVVTLEVGVSELLVTGVIELSDVGSNVELVEAHPVKAKKATVVNPQIRLMILIQSPQYRPTVNNDLKT